jgi:Nucleotidyl transferase AbiEii toxin, Type IV TA system
MPPSRTYATAGAFRRALEERLKNASQAEQVDPNRLRRQVSFDRLLARLFREESAPWALKGGYALELRFKAARSTVDIDLTLQRVTAATSSDGDTNQVVRSMLQSVANLSLGDWFEFEIGPPVMDLTAAPYGGARYPVEARMDERTFARFHLDAGIGDVVIQPLETIICRDWLGFAGIESARVRMIAREQQFAEKIHAYTLPRNAANSRVKDLVDLALLIGSGGLDRQRILDALRLTFERRGTHDLPTGLVAPPADWQIPFQALAEECGLQTDVAAVFAGVQEYFEEVLTRRTEL